MLASRTTRSPHAPALAAPRGAAEHVFGDGARAPGPELAAWRLRREAATAARCALLERVRAQNALGAVLRAEREHVCAMARSLAAECALLRDAVRSNRAYCAPPCTRDLAGTCAGSGPTDRASGPGGAG